MAERSEQEIQQEIEQRLQELSLFEEDARQQGFSVKTLSEEELAERIQGESSSSPSIGGQAWFPRVSRGSTTRYRAFIFNPDPTAYGELFLSIYFGVANFLEIGEGLTARDTQWPLLSTEGFSIAPTASIEVPIVYTTPSFVLFSTYHLNSVLWQRRSFDKGITFDRGSVDITLT